METINGNPAEPSNNSQEPAKKMGRFSASLLITKESWNLLKKDKEMMAFPVFSAVASLFSIGIIGILFFFVILSGSLDNIDQADSSSYIVDAIFAFIMYFVTTFIVIFFETGIITIVRGRLNGQNLTISDGLNNSLSKIGKIVQWSLVSATVGTVLKLISDRSAILGKIVAAVLGAAWSIVTFFIAPILIAEDLSVKESLKKSAAVIRKTWGETVIINIGVGFFFGLLALVGILIFVGTLFTMNAKIIIASGILLLVYLVVLIIISSTLGVIFKVILYEYANSGSLPEGFSKDILGMAFREDEKKKSMLGI